MPVAAAAELMQIEILTFADCPNARLAHERTAEALAAEAVAADVVEIMVETPEAAIAHRFAGSPSIRVNGRDVEPNLAHGYGLMCRTYRVDANVEGAPSVTAIRNAIRSATGR